MPRKEVQHCDKISFLALHRSTQVILQDDKLHFPRTHLRLTKLHFWSDLENEISIWCPKLNQQRALHHKLVLDFFISVWKYAGSKRIHTAFYPSRKKTKETNPANCYCADNPLGRQCNAVYQPGNKFINTYDQSWCREWSRNTAWVVSVRKWMHLLRMRDKIFRTLISSLVRVTEKKLVIKC